MRSMSFMVILMVMTAHLAFGAPTVFFSDGTKMTGSSIWLENKNVYLSSSNQVYEFGGDDVNWDSTLNHNKLGKTVGAYLANPQNQVMASNQVTGYNTSGESGNSYLNTEQSKTTLKPPMASGKPSVNEPIISVPEVIPAKIYAGELPVEFIPGDNNLQTDLVMVYSKFCHAAKSGNFSEISKYLTRNTTEKSVHTITQLQDNQGQYVHKVKINDMTTKTLWALGSAISPTSNMAVLVVKGKRAGIDGSIHDGKGSVLFVKEASDWKIRFDVWTL